MYIHKKIIAAWVAAAMLVPLAACGEKKNTASASQPSNSAVQTDTESQDTSSLSSDAMKELESVPGLDSDSIAAQNGDTTDTDTAADTDTENTDTEEPTGAIKSSSDAEPQDFDIGGLTLSAAEIPFGETVKLKNADSGDAVLYGDTMYLLNGKELREFTVGEQASEKGKTAVSGSYSRVDADPYGQLYLSRDRFDCAVIDESGEQRPIDTAGELSMSKVMEYGLCTNNGEITKFINEDMGEWSSVAEKDLKFPDNVSAVEFSGNHVLIAHTEDGSSGVDVCDYDGQLIASTEGGSVGEDITAVAETSGVIAASSCGDLCLWNSDGDLIGRLSSDDTASLLGCGSPVVIKRLFPGDSGELLAFCADETPNTCEAKLFRITGF